ncbi:MAG: hypothetical protein J1E40_06120, partial [Oscillospiraceae bacterium]|nr:hypothetical protein [Oscillospiraceae bacterium]
MNTVKPEKIRSMQQLFNSLISDKTRDNLPKYALLAGAGCSVPSGVASGKRIIDIIQKYTYLLRSNDCDNELLAKWNHQTQTLEAFITEVESSIDFDKLQSYIASMQKIFREEMEKPNFCLKLINTLPNNLKEPLNGFEINEGSPVERTAFSLGDPKDKLIWEKYCNYFQEEL